MPAGFEDEAAQQRLQHNPPPPKQGVDVSDMKLVLRALGFRPEVVSAVLRNALDAFARLDLTVAAKVVRQDEQVDSEFKSILRQLITFMMEDPRTISHSLDILFIAKSIERIGDHAKNMSEYVVFLVKGKDVRHTSIEAFEREALG